MDVCGRRSCGRRRGVTVVEILVVFVILAILGALIGPTIARVMGSARETEVIMEIGKLEHALRGVANELGEFPPCAADRDATTRGDRMMAALRRLYPRASRYTSYSSVNSTLQSEYSAISGASARDLDNLDHAEMLVFWLGGLPAPVDGPSKLIGFAADPTHPLNPDPAARRLPRAFEFDESRLVDTDGDGWWEYAPPMDAETLPAPPYVYYDGPTVGAGLFRPYPFRAIGSLPAAGDDANIAQWGVATPYADKRNEWLNLASCQIVCAGSDGQYGKQGVSTLRRPVPATGNGCVDGDYDNLTNLFDGTIASGLEK